MLKVSFLLFGCLLITAAASEFIAGGVRPLEGEALKEAETTLSNSLSTLAAGDGPSYTISTVRSATVQVVAGSLYKYNVELVDGSGTKKDCEVSIWSRPWLPNGNEVTFNCAGEEKVVKTHS